MRLKVAVVTVAGLSSQGIKAFMIATRSATPWPEEALVITGPLTP